MIKEKLYIFLDFDGVLNNADTDFGRTYLKDNNEVGWDNYNTLNTYKLINKLEEMYEEYGMTEFDLELILEKLKI